MYVIFIYLYSYFFASPPQRSVQTKKKEKNQGSLSFFTLTSPARMVAISPCMKAHGTFEPTRGHFSPLGQYTSPVAPCCFMLSLEHGKQNLWEGTDGHWTKCVSSKRSWHSVQHRGMLLGTEESGMLCGGCTWSMPGTWGVPALGASLCASLLWLMEDGDRGLLLFLRVVEWTWLASLGELFPPALSAAMMSAAMGDWPFWAASGGVVREWGDIVEGGEAKLGGGTGGIFSPSVGGGNHCCPSPLSLAAVASPSGSGDAFLLLLPRGCFPLSGGRKGLNRAVELHSSYKDQQLAWKGDVNFANSCCTTGYKTITNTAKDSKNLFIALIILGHDFINTIFTILTHSWVEN